MLVPWQGQTLFGIFLFAVEKQHIQYNLVFPSTLCPVSMPLYYVIFQGFCQILLQIYARTMCSSRKIRKQRLFCQKSPAICFWPLYVIFHHAHYQCSLKHFFFQLFFFPLFKLNILPHSVFSPTPRKLVLSDIKCSQLGFPFRESISIVSTYGS